MMMIDRQYHRFNCKRYGLDFPFINNIKILFVEERIKLEHVNHFFRFSRWIRQTYDIKIHLDPVVL